MRNRDILADPIANVRMIRGRTEKAVGQERFRRNERELAGIPSGDLAEKRLDFPRPRIKIGQPVLARRTKRQRIDQFRLIFHVARRIRRGRNMSMIRGQQNQRPTDFPSAEPRDQAIQIGQEFVDALPDAFVGHAV